MHELRVPHLACSRDLRTSNLYSLELALQELKTALGAVYTDEDADVRIQLTHDRGMRLRELVISDTFGLRKHVLYQVSDAISYRCDAGCHVLTIDGIVLSWPTRPIPLGNGEFDYL